MARRVRSPSGLAKGTRRATGVPCLVITIRSPFATRYSRRAKWVLASEAPMVFMLVFNSSIYALNASLTGERAKGVPPRRRSGGRRGLAATRR